MLGGQMTWSKDAQDETFHLESASATETAQSPGPEAGLIVLGRARGSAIAVIRPMTDYHYGNDVALKPGARVTAKVTVKGQTAVLHLTAPR
jgi:hypothetical protein